MNAIWIMMCPVDDATLTVVFIDTCKVHLVTDGQGFDPGSDIDIVRYQQSLTRRKPENETLVLAAFGVVTQQALNCTRTSDIHTLLPGFKQPGQLFIC